MILQHSQSRLGFIIWEVILFPKVIKVSIYQLKDKKSYKTLTKHIHILFNSIHVVIFQTNYQLIHDKVKHMVSFSFLLLLNICVWPFWFDLFAILRITFQNHTFGSLGPWSCDTPYWYESHTNEFANIHWKRRGYI